MKRLSALLGGILVLVAFSIPAPARAWTGSLSTCGFDTNLADYKADVESKSDIDFSDVDSTYVIVGIPPAPMDFVQKYETYWWPNGNITAYTDTENKLGTPAEDGIKAHSETSLTTPTNSSIIDPYNNPSAPIVQINCVEETKNVSYNSNYEGEELPGSELPPPEMCEWNEAIEADDPACVEPEPDAPALTKTELQEVLAQYTGIWVSLAGLGYIVYLVRYRHVN